MTRDINVSELIDITFQVRLDILEMLTLAKSGHLGGSLGVTDIVVSLYFNLLRHSPKNPQWEQRDRVVLSAGHLAPALYATLARTGYFPIEELKTLRQLGTRLQGHPSLGADLPGIETSSGSLGQGLGIAVGMALAARIKHQNHKVVSIHGDGELQEGAIWEAAMSASHYKLSNLVAIVDRNKLQIDGHTEEVLSLEPLADKWKAFGWAVKRCNGNDVKDFIQAFSSVDFHGTKPTVILANTIMGYGVPSIENDYRWHGKVPTNEEYESFKEQLRKKYRDISGRRDAQVT